MEKIEKEYKVSSKIYYNNRLKKSLFHEKLMHPLYVQITFDRIPMTFKSYYYNLFSKSKYAIRVGKEVFAPDIKDIIKKEETLIDFIINRNVQSFSLELFIKEYAYFSRDLLDIMEESFLDYLFTFFHDEGLPFLAHTINEGSSDGKLYDLVGDMKSAFNPLLYKKLIENSFHFAPPYLPLYSFTEKPKRTLLRCLTVMEWEQPETKRKFIDYLTQSHPEHDIMEILDKVKNCINQ